MRPVDWWAVVMTLLFAAALRIIGIGHGQLNPAYFPSYASKGMTHELLPVQPDEFLSVGIPVDMALRDSWNPRFFEYPNFIVNVSRVLLHLTGSLDGLSLDDRAGSTLREYAPFSHYVAARMFSVFGGLLMTACAYAICRMVAGRYAALLSALLVASSFTLVQHAHYIKPGSLAAGWMAVSAWAGIASLYARRWRSRHLLYLLACAVTGLAATTRYNAVCIALITIPIGLILLYRHRYRRALRTVAVAWLLIPLVFIIGSPYILRDFDAFWRDFSYIVGQFQSSGANVPAYFLVDAWTGLAYLLQYSALFAIGIPALIFMCLALLAPPPLRSLSAFPRHNSPLLIAALIWLLLIAYALIALRTIRPGHSENLLILILPFAAILAAFGASWLQKRLKLPSWLVMPALCLLLIIQPLTLSVQLVKQFSQPDTRQIMLDWVHENIPPGARFFINGPYNLPLDDAIYPNERHLTGYVEKLPSGAEFDYLVYADAVAFDALRSDMVPEPVKQEQRDYLARLDDAYTRFAKIQRPVWSGSEAMMNTASFWHNPTLVLYCLNPSSCSATE